MILGKTKTYFFLALATIEKIFAYLQGKGYGSNSTYREVFYVLKLLNASPKIAVDIGGNIGDYSFNLLKLTRNKIVNLYIFEPSQMNFGILKKRFLNFKKIVILPFALSDKSDYKMLYSNQPGSGLASLYNRDLRHFNIKFGVSEKIKTLRFDSFWKKRMKSSIIDIVKLDIEGSEFVVLSGFGNAINHIKIIQFEFSGCNLDSRVFFHDFWIFFTEKNFDLYRISPFGLISITQYSEALEFFSTTNYIAVNRSFI